MEKENAWILSAVLLTGGAIAVGVVLQEEEGGGSAEVSEASADWVRPEGSPEELARDLSVHQLVGRWAAFPAEDDLGVHADYARALGILGPDAAEAAGDLAPHATHAHPELRQAVLAALSRMGDEGLQPLLDAVQYGALEDAQASDVRWDAAQALAAREEGIPAEAVPPLLERLMNFQEHVLVRESLAVAIARAVPPATEALAEAQQVFYARSEEEGLTVAETGVLRTINLALQGVVPQPAAPPQEEEEPEEDEE